MQDLAKKFGNTIRERRLRLGISQDALALMTDIDRSYVGRIERGEVNVTLEKAYKIAQALDCDIQDLLP
ncbi:helix-turn-helix domain-containing protein [Aeromonas veronii]|uniref:XRE family transcriptional regulator n=1 Tax=Aeromonas veronii TaxID=654 RepID=A0AAN1UP46_AERVE|nr:helix-turn-helix transcriptional regulator [Aeromonas veronii]AYV36562.1 XRE family transcriptional regulator [Aeromonas veronii]